MFKTIDPCAQINCSFQYLKAYLKFLLKSLNVKCAFKSDYKVSLIVHNMQSVISLDADVLAFKAQEA